MMDPSTRLDEAALDLRVQAINVTQRLGLVTVGDLATVTEADLRERGARDVDVNALRALIVAAGGHFAGVRRGRPPSRRGDLVRVETWMDPEQLARLDEQRGAMSRSAFVAQIFGR